MSEPLHTNRFPGESDAYRSARNELLQAEMNLRRNIEEVAAFLGSWRTHSCVPCSHSCEHELPSVKIVNIGHRREMELALLFITHDLGVVAKVADRVAVMYAGRIIEEGPTQDVLRSPQHPYTQGLLAASPTIVRGQLIPIPGAVPQLISLPPGCAFAPRCGYRRAECDRAVPAFRPPHSDHSARCVLL